MFISANLYYEYCLVVYEILQVAGSWSDLSDEDYLELTAEIKRNSSEMFNKSAKQ